MFRSREKGSSAEREVAGLLKDWWRQIEPDCVFVKTPLSGGWGSPGLRAGFRASGDICTTAIKFPFTVESKRREKWSLEQFLKGSRSPIWGWWSQSNTQAEEMQAWPMLWFRRNNERWRVMIPLYLKRRLDWPELVHEWNVQLILKHTLVTPILLNASELLDTHPKNFLKRMNEER